MGAKESKRAASAKRIGCLRLDRESTSDQGLASVDTPEACNCSLGYRGGVTLGASLLARALRCLTRLERR